MKIRVSLGIGISGAYRHGVLEIPDKELEGMTEEERDEYITSEYVEVWANNYIDLGYSEVE